MLHDLMNGLFSSTELSPAFLVELIGLVIIVEFIGMCMDIFTGGRKW